MKQRVPFLALLAALAFTVSSGTAFAQTGTTYETSPTDKDDDYDGPQGQADEGPALSGIIIGLLFIGLVALFFVAYLRYRD